MLDIKYIRDHQQQCTTELAKRGVAPAVVKKLLSLDEVRRETIASIEKLKAKKNEFNKSIGQLSAAQKNEKIEEMAALTRQQKKFQDQLEATASTMQSVLSDLPNLPANDVKVGKDETENEIIKTIGEKTSFTFSPKDYMEIALLHDLIDTRRAAKVSGSRFGYLKGDGALLWSALVQYAMDILLKEKFIPFYSPSLIKRDAMENSGYDSYTDGQDAYYIEKDDLFLVGTGEHALLPYHSGEVLPESDLPLRYTTYSSCYRREAGSYGKDTKGILRVHQFDKQEMVVLTTPEKSWDTFDWLVGIQEQIISGLELPYHLLAVCTGDLPKPSAKVIDLECWLPSDGAYRETHSASNCTDYQARRNAIRYKGNNGAAQFVHILNATGITPRTLIALLENHQQADGSVSIPKALRAYMRGATAVK
ncbi:MAG: serine--tRNA ligase [Patescibacteria group bacterium]